MGMISKVDTPTPQYTGMVVVPKISSDVQKLCMCMFN